MVEYKPVVLEKFSKNGRRNLLPKLSLIFSNRSIF